MEETIRLGLGRRIITPKVGCALYGYRPDLFSESVHDDLKTTAFYLVQGDTKILLITNDLCAFGTDLAQEILQDLETEFAIPKENILLHATHTHTGPNCSGTIGWGERNVEYCETVLKPRLKEAVRDAVAKTEPVQIVFKQGKSYVGINRREQTLENTVKLGQNPWGAFDPTMSVFTFLKEDGKPLANIIHYGCHGTAAGQSHEISRDWSGVMCDALERESGAVSAFFCGQEGDVGPRLSNGKTVGGGLISFVLELGVKAARDAIAIYRQKGVVLENRLEASTKEVHIPLLPRISKEEADERRKEFEGATVNLKAKKLAYYTMVSRSYDEGYEEKESSPFSQTVIRLGDVVLVGAPFEVFTEIAMRIAHHSPFSHSLTVVNSNGCGRYLVSQDQICRGGYEVGSFLTGSIQSYVHDADFHVIRQTIDHLNEMKGR